MDFDRFKGKRYQCDMKDASKIKTLKIFRNKISLISPEINLCYNFQAIKPTLNFWI